MASQLSRRLVLEAARLGQISYYEGSGVCRDCVIEAGLGQDSGRCDQEHDQDSRAATVDEVVAHLDRHGES